MTVNFKNKSINYQTKGSGNTIVLLHGFLESLTIWDAFVEILSKTNKIITINLPGFGLSANIAKIHTMEIMADCVKAVLDQEQINECVMAGHSMGGYTALAFAGKHPESIRGLCLFNSQAAADSDEAKINRDRTINLIENDRLNFINSFIPDLFADSNKPKFKDQIEALKMAAAKTSKEGIIAALLGMRERPDSLMFLTSFIKPVLFIAGKQDKRISTETILKQASLPSHSEVLLLENVGHMGFIEAKELTMKVLGDYANRCFEYG